MPRVQELQVRTPGLNRTSGARYPQAGRRLSGCFDRGAGPNVVATEGLAHFCDHFSLHPPGAPLLPKRGFDDGHVLTSEDTLAGTRGEDKTVEVSPGATPFPFTFCFLSVLLTRIRLSPFALTACFLSFIYSGFFLP